MFFLYPKKEKKKKIPCGLEVIQLPSKPVLRVVNHSLKLIKRRDD
jgi:hypothetical protein